MGRVDEIFTSAIWFVLVASINRLAARLVSGAIEREKLYRPDENHGRLIRALLYVQRRQDIVGQRTAPQSRHVDRFQICGFGSRPSDAAD